MKATFIHLLHILILQKGKKIPAGLCSKMARWLQVMAIVMIKMWTE